MAMTSEILTWLSPLEPHLRHHAIRTSRVKNVGDWLLRTEEFRSWRTGDGRGESQKATIFCSGNLGVGKTCISSLVVDSLCDEPGEAGEDIAVACFYFDSATQKEQSATSVLGALLKQVVGGLEKIPEEITGAFRRHKKFIGGRELQLPEIVKMLASLSSTQRTFFCLDALDECASPDRANVLLSLKDIIKMIPTTRVFLTGRPYVGVEVGKHFSEGAAFLSISPRNDDIIQYIHTKLAEDTASGEMDERLEEEIVKKIPELAPEIFLSVSLGLDAILQETTIRRRRERLRIMITGFGLGDIYNPTLDRIKAQDSYKSRLGTTALMWICHSERELGAEELCQALAVDIESTDYSADNAPSIQAVLNCCQGLVIVDKEGSVVRLIHHTLREYLVSHRSLFRRPHSTLAETCLTYLNSRQVMALSGSRLQSTQHSPFLQYSSLYWGAHMQKEITDRGKALALKLFSRYKCHISIRLLLEHTLGDYPLESIVDFRKFTGLHCASLFGLVEVARALIGMDGVNINSMDETGAIPLLWAAMSGQAAAVKLLLGLNGVTPDKPDYSGRTPMSWASRNGHEAVVKLLLGREDVNSDRVDSAGNTPLLYAIENGHTAVVQLLLARKDTNPDRARNYHRALRLAARGGDEAVVGLLLERKDINPDEVGWWGGTPLSLAAEEGHEAVAKLLLGRKDVNPDRPDDNGQTPVLLAAYRGHEAVVRLLLGRKDVNPGKPDDNGQTPILCAAGNGHEAVVKLLIGREDVNPDWPNSDGLTPILLAALCGHEAVVKLLLGHKDIKPDRQGDSGRTPISRAAENGREAVVRLLLERGDVHPDRVDNAGRTAISWAAENGHEAVVKLLLGREDVKSDRPDDEGRTPISWATEYGHEGVVKLLLGWKAVNPGTLDV